MDAATGEIYIEDARKAILGSSGHALNLKYSNPTTRYLKVILVEKDVNCYAHLKKTIKRTWRNADVNFGRKDSILARASTFTPSIFPMIKNEARSVGTA